MHHDSTQDGVDVFMLVEKEYPLRAGVLDVMRTVKLRCWERTEVIDDLLQRIYDQSVRADRELRRRNLKKLIDLCINHKLREDCWELY